MRTILQHAWAEIEHDIQYKSVETIPSLIRRRFMSLAGLLEIADREFQAIQNEDEQLRQEARISVVEGQLEKVEITPDALKAYLDKTLGSDGRMTDWSYQWTARMLRRMGFTNFKQIDALRVTMMITLVDFYQGHGKGNSADSSFFCKLAWEKTILIGIFGNLMIGLSIPAATTSIR